MGIPKSNQSEDKLDMFQILAKKACFSRHSNQNKKYGNVTSMKDVIGFKRNMNSNVLDLKISLMTVRLYILIP